MLCYVESIVDVLNSDDRVDINVIDIENVIDIDKLNI